MHVAVATARVGSGATATSSSPSQAALRAGFNGDMHVGNAGPVSYTHLTLPTISSV